MRKRVWSQFCASAEETCVYQDGRAVSGWTLSSEPKGARD
jgi:hypothetical protein